MFIMKVKELKSLMKDTFLRDDVIFNIEDFNSHTRVRLYANEIPNKYNDYVIITMDFLRKKEAYILIGDLLYR